MGTEKYPSLSRMVKALFSCFHGPLVEGSFNLMGDVMGSQSCRMDVATYSAIQSVNYPLLEVKRANTNCKEAAVQFFQTKDFLHDAPNAALVRNMRSSYMQYAVAKEEKRKATEEKMKELKNKAQAQ